MHGRLASTASMAPKTGQACRFQGQVSPVGLTAAQSLARLCFGIGTTTPWRRRSASTSCCSTPQAAAEMQGCPLPAGKVAEHTPKAPRRTNRRRRPGPRTMAGQLVHYASTACAKVCCTSCHAPTGHLIPCASAQCGPSSTTSGLGGGLFKAQVRSRLQSRTWLCTLISTHSEPRKLAFVNSSWYHHQPSITRQPL
jgi:hypothetical protein